VNLQQSPLQSLQQGHWFKLICGASFQHLPAIRSLALAYTLAGADCIDVAADAAVIHAARAGIEAAQNLARSNPLTPIPQVWLMVSLNDGEDPHFRKAVFDPKLCPTNCPQPCVSICPAEAIAFTNPLNSGVIEDRCYGCGRCLPICPVRHIETRSQPATPATILPLVEAGFVDAIELHTQMGHEAEFGALWANVAPIIPTLNLLAVSCPEEDGVLEYLERLYDIMHPLPCPLIWQTDGRSMSGDIGDGATRATINYGEKVLRSPLPGYIQLAGGTNDHTVLKLKERGLLRDSFTITTQSQNWISGIAYGSYARRLFSPIQTQLEAQPQSSFRLEDYPELLTAGVKLATQLITPLKVAVSNQRFL
jgi:Fe-S-cluster-containing hydrogenase component 2